MTMKPQSAGARLMHAFLALPKAADAPEDQVEALYRFVARYRLAQKSNGLGDGLRNWIGDAAWALRMARRQGLRVASMAYMAMRYLRRSPFDEAFYALQLQETPWANLSPVRHYVLFGVADYLDPAPGFNTGYYLLAHDDVRRSGVNPFVHYLKYGRHEQRHVEPSARVDFFIRSIAQKYDVSGEMTQDEFDLPSALEAMATPKIEGVETLAWPCRDKKMKRGDLKPYDVRPDDTVIAQADLAEAFLSAHGLLTDKPQWEAATAAVCAAGRDRPVRQRAPDVSIIIPVYGQLAYTLNCLDGLLRHRSRYSFEIIVGDDASLDESAQWLGRIDRVTYQRHPVNEGFIANCNATAKLAEGRFIVFLNNDTRVCEGWLDHLIDTFETFPETGLVGSKLFYPDGVLQEAGGIVWQDGSAWNYGRNDDPNRPRYSYARDVDYVSGAAIALPHALWRQLDGFDSLYAPAYYEDTDLAFRVRQAGLKVVMQPLSRLIHYEGRTSGTDPATGAKAYQVVNGLKFSERWAEVLKHHRPNGDMPWLEKERDKTRRVLIIDATTPTRSTDAGSAATIALMKQYQALGFKVSFVPEDNFLFQPVATGYLQSIGIECLYAPYEASMSRLLLRYSELFEIVHLIRPGIAARNLELIRRLAPDAKILYLNADLHYLRMERQAAVEKNADLLALSQEMKAREIALAGAVDANLVHSTSEKSLLEAEGVTTPIIYYPLTEKVVASPPSQTRTDIMFLGGYNHPPNLDAALWLLDELWPPLAAHLPQARLLLVGANPPPALLARADSRILVTGLVDELAPWFARSRVFIAPLRYGAGAKGKVLSAMAHGVPVVATAIAAEGMPFVPGKSIFLADTTDEIISETLGLYQLTDTAWQPVARAAQAYVGAEHNDQAGLNALKRAIEGDQGQGMSALSHPAADTAA